MTGPDPRVSVVIATNRGGPWLDEAVASVLAQTIDDLEVIIVDDGVPGGVRQLAALDDRIRLVAGRQAGISTARNIGNAAARGELVAVLDDDDRWMPDKLERQLALLDRHPESAMCHTQFERINADGVVIGPGWSSPAGIAELLAGTAGVLHSSTLWRKSVLVAVGGYDPGFSRGVDTELLLRVSGTWPSVFDPSVLVQYRVHRTQTSGSGAYREIFTEVRRIHRKHLPRLAASHPELRCAADSVSRRVFAEVAVDEAVREVKAGRLVAALGHGAWVLRTDPVAATRYIGRRGAERARRMWGG